MFKLGYSYNKIANLALGLAIIKIAGTASAASLSPHSFSSSQQNNFHVVSKGDTYYNLAKKYNTTVNAIKEANKGIDPTRLRIGYKLNIPSTSNATTTVMPKRNVNAASVSSGLNALTASNDWKNYKKKREQFEGYKAKSYLDSNKKRTIGTGFNMDDEGNKAWFTKNISNDPNVWNNLYSGKAEWNREWDNKYLDYRTRADYNRLQRYIKPEIFNQLSNNAKIAMLDTMYNNAAFIRGPVKGGFPKFFEALNNGNYSEAYKEFDSTIDRNNKKAPGLNKRWDWRREVWNTPDSAL